MEYVFVSKYNEGWNLLSLLDNGKSIIWYNMQQSFGNSTTKTRLTGDLWCMACAGLHLNVGSANDRWCYTVMLSVIGWAHIQNDPWWDVRILKKISYVTMRQNCIDVCNTAEILQMFLVKKHTVSQSIFLPCSNDLWSCLPPHNAGMPR